MKHYEKPFGYHGVETILANPTYIGLPAWGKVGVGAYRILHGGGPVRVRRKPTDTLVVRKGEEQYIQPVRPVFAPIVPVELWQRVQSQFVDDPAAAVSSADRVIQQVMGERGYPVEDFEQRVTDVSVDHPQVVEHYRQAHAIADSSAQHDAPTEDLRQAMRHYRALFDDLLETSADEPLTRDATASKPTAMERMRRS